MEWNILPILEQSAVPINFSASALDDSSEAPKYVVSSVLIGTRTQTGAGTASPRLTFVLPQDIHLTTLGIR